MSATATAWQRWQPPTVQDQSPWQLALAGKTDQGGGESAPGPWEDNTPRLGGGAFGTTYADPGGGWNPWSLYDGREGYDGTAVDGWYNAGADTAKGWGPNGTPESDRDRVWRMTLADLGPNPGGQSPERVKAAFLNNVTRLKRDYMGTQGLGAQAWAGSAFAGYDKLAQGGQAAATQGPGRGRDDGTGWIAGQPGQQGGSNVADPFFSSGGGTPASAAQAAAQAAGRRAAQAVSGARGQVTGSATANNGGVGSTTSGGMFGQSSIDDWLTAVSGAKDDPGIAAHLLRLAQGQKGRTLTRLGGYRDNLYGKALQTYLAGSGGGSQQNMQDFLAAMQGGGGGIMNFLGNAAGDISGQDFTGMKDEDIETALASAVALASLNQGRVGGARMSSGLEDLLYQQEGDTLTTGANDQDNLGTKLRGSLYEKFMRQFQQYR